MAYVALYRKFRPPIFDDVKGQDHIVTTLKNQIKSDRIGHAYLFCGTRGTGKTSVAKILARAVNCETPKDGNPCGECPTCKAIESGAAMGNVIEIDAASNNGVDNIREIIDEISYSPTVGKYKVYIIDEVHMLSAGAFNALLKSLEEPPSYVIFILATTEVHKIPITILSRCQRYDFHRITIDTIADRLKEVVTAENVQVEDKAIRYIAKAADGSMRDSLSLLDQCIAFNYGEELTYDRVLNVLGAVDTAIFGDLFSCLIKQDVTGALEILSEIVIQGRELTQFVSDFIWYLRNLMLVSTSDGMEDAVDMSTDNLRILKELSADTDIDTIMRYIRVFSDLSASLRFASQKRILIEVALIRICKPQMEDGNDALTDRIRILEEKADASDKILSGIQSGQIAVASGGAAARSSAQAVNPAPKKEVLEKAVAEDVKRVVNDWGRILINMQNPMRTYLEKAVLSQGNDGKLFIVLDNKERVEKYNNEPGKEELNTVLDNAIGKHIEFEMRYAGQDRPVEEQYINLTGIHFDIVTENEENMPERESVQESSGADASDEPEYSEEESGGMIVSGAVDDMDGFSADAGFDDENAFEEKDDDSEE
ncbi:MAG: DNA polymerase III subunit gamma/tau [Butyrivibrio sp.]|nr:DNA polymerase III subunit gamma/tau [Butyrivibrio sp.]